MSGGRRVFVSPVLLVGGGITLLLLGVVAGALLVPVVPEDQPPSARPKASLPHQATAAQEKATADPFGISYLRPTRPGGTYWISSWAASRRFSGVDPNDDWFDAGHGEGTYSAGGGLLEISGDAPRMYVYDPKLQRQWRDVEITMYFKRVADSGIPYTGMTAVARTNHLFTEGEDAARCDTRGYGGRFRFDGRVDFEKETAHPDNVSIGAKEVFAGGMPVGKWLGYKYLVSDDDDGVRLQLYVDTTNGVGGGDWLLVSEALDTGHAVGETPCDAGIDPRMALTNSPRREGSESGRPNLSVFFRSDGIAANGMVYKWGSIREITP